MDGNVKWSALTFLAGVIVATVVWTYFLIQVVDERIGKQIAVHEAIFHHENGPDRP